MFFSIFKKCGDRCLARTQPLAEFFSSKGYGLVYGGGNRGNMGVISNEFSNKGAKVSGYTLQLFHKRGLLLTTLII